MNKYQELFKQLQKEKESINQSPDDHIMIFDGLNTFIRSFSATPSTNEDGEHIGGITGFLYSIGKCVRDFKPSRCIIVFDGVGGSKRRKKIYKDYKGNRANKTRLRRHDHHFANIEQEQEAMRYQFSRLVSYLDALPVTFLSMDGIEADDTIAYITQMYEEKSKKITIISTDRDFYQLVNDQIEIWSPIKKKMYDTERVLTEFGVHPKNYVMYRSFTGDKSDNIPGVHGCGIKTLVKRFPEITENKKLSVDDLFSLAEEKKGKIKIYDDILKSKEQILMNRELMQLDDPDISGNIKMSILGRYDEEINPINKLNIMKVLVKYKVTDAFGKNFNDWLRDTFGNIITK